LVKWGEAAGRKCEHLTESSSFIVENPGLSGFNVDNRVCESCQIAKESCFIVFNRGKIKESFFPGIA
jgi:hypothetical protein